MFNTQTQKNDDIIIDGMKMKKNHKLKNPFDVPDNYVPANKIFPADLPAKPIKKN